MENANQIPPDNDCYHLLEFTCEEKSEIILLSNATYSVGRDPSNAITISSPSISRQHALLLRVLVAQSDQHLFRIVDGNLQGKKSTNGIYINGRKQSSWILKHGDEITFGAYIKANYYNFYTQSGLTDPEAIKAAFLAGISDNDEQFGTVILDQQENESAEEAILHLASFPELIPNPILEVDIAGTITYLNPSAIETFPDIRDKGKKHPILKAIFAALDERSENSFGCEFSYQEAFYEAAVHTFPESDILRVFIFDMTEKKAAEAAQRLAESKYRSIFENAIEGIFQTTLEGQYLTVNPTLAKIYGYDSPAHMLESIQDINTQLYLARGRRQQFIEKIIKDGYVYGFESQIRRRDGKIIWISENARAVHSEEGRCIGFEGSVQDITNRKLAERELLKRDRLLQAVSEAANSLLVNLDFQAAMSASLQTIGEALETSHLALCRTAPDPHRSEAYLNIECEWFSDSTTSIITNRFWKQQNSHQSCISAWLEELQSGKAVSITLNTSNQIERYFIESSGIQSIVLVPISAAGKLWGFLSVSDCSVCRDWSSQEEFTLLTVAASIGGAIHRRQVEQSMRHRALHDSLTELPNRTLFNEQLSWTLRNTERGHKSLAVMFLDLDRFKFINDTLGHTIGDNLLQQVAQRLTTAVRSGDLVARWGGDEFIILIPHFTTQKTLHSIAERILTALDQIFLIESHELYVTGSLGIALLDATKPDAETLVKRADIALYQAKESGRNAYRIYDTSMDSRAPEIMALEKYLRHALKREEFQVLYQPRVNLIDGSVDGMEALLRWQHPVMGMVAPSKFIPIAEDNGLILSIGEWVLRQACAQNKRWQEAGFAPIRVAVNLSPKQFRQSNLVAMVASVLEETGLGAQYLELEITETTAVQDIDFTRDIFERLSRMGVQLSIDDFGTGHSSLSRLQILPINYLKIDKSFVQDLSVNKKVLHIISTIVALGKSLGLKIVAEGVETDQQLSFLKSIECETAQGFFFHRPISVEEVEKLLQDSSLLSP